MPLCAFALWAEASAVLPLWDSDVERVELTATCAGIMKDMSSPSAGVWSGAHARAVAVWLATMASAGWGLALDSARQCAVAAGAHLTQPGAWQVVAAVMEAPDFDAEDDGWPLAGPWMDAALDVLAERGMDGWEAAVRACVFVVAHAPRGTLELLPARPKWTPAVASVLLWMSTGGPTPVWADGTPPRFAAAASRVLTRLLHSGVAKPALLSTRMHPLPCCFASPACGRPVAWLPGRCGVFACPCAHCGNPDGRSYKGVQMACGDVVHPHCALAMGGTCTRCRADLYRLACQAWDAEAGVKW